MEVKKRNNININNQKEPLKKDILQIKIEKKENIQKQKKEPTKSSNSPRSNSYGKSEDKRAIITPKVQRDKNIM